MIALPILLLSLWRRTCQDTFLPSHSSVYDFQLFFHYILTYFGPCVHACGCTTYGSQFSPSITGYLEIKLSLIGLGSGCLYLLSHGEDAHLDTFIEKSWNVYSSWTAMKVGACLLLGLKAYAVNVTPPLPPASNSPFAPDWCLPVPPSGTMPCNVLPPPSQAIVPATTHLLTWPQDWDSTSLAQRQPG